jgi:hypothetical protein
LFPVFDLVCTVKSTTNNDEECRRLLSWKLGEEKQQKAIKYTSCVFQAIIVVVVVVALQNDTVSNGTKGKKNERKKNFHADKLWVTWHASDGRRSVVERYHSIFYFFNLLGRDDHLSSISIVISFYFHDNIPLLDL